MHRVACGDGRRGRVALFDGCGTVKNKHVDDVLPAVVDECRGAIDVNFYVTSNNRHVPTNDRATSQKIDDRIFDVVLYNAHVGVFV